MESTEEVRLVPLRPLLEKKQRRRGLFLSIVEGMSAQAHTSITGLGAGGPNAITVGFALLLGARDPALGLLAALPVLGNVLQFAGAALAARSRTRRELVAITSTIARVSWLAIGAIPFVAKDRLDAGLGAFLVLWFVTNALLSLSGNLWVSWMADLVPRAIRGRYFSRRTLFTQIVAITAPIVASFVLDEWFGGVPRREDVAAPRDLQAHGFFIVFACAALFGIACGVLLWWSPEPERGPLSPPPLDGSWALQPFRDRRFRPLLCYLAAFGATNGLSNPFWDAFKMEELHMSYAAVNAFVAIQGFATLVVLPFWGRLNDRVGSRPIIAIALGLICLHPLYYVFSAAAPYGLMVVDATSSGLAWAGYNLALFNLVLALAPRERREVYFASYVTVLGTCQAISSVLSGSLIGRLPETLELFGFTLDARQQIFLATSIARMGCLAFFVTQVEDPGSRTVRAVVAEMHAYVKSRMNWKMLPD